MSPHHDGPHAIKMSSYQQLQAAAAWAVIRAQCPINYDDRRRIMCREYDTHLHLRALTQYLRELKGGEPGAFNYTLWAFEAVCTARKHEHVKPISHSSQPSPPAVLDGPVFALLDVDGEKAPHLANVETNDLLCSLDYEGSTQYGIVGPDNMPDTWCADCRAKASSQ